MVFIFYRLVISDVIHQQEFQYKSLESVISDTFLTLEKLSEKSSLLSLKSIRSEYNNKPLPDDSELKLIASKMGVSQIAATDSHGIFTRDTVTPKAERIKKLFDFCSDYKEMVTKNKEKIFVTPILPAFPNKGPYKFIMISDPSHNGVLEVGVKLEFISRLLSYVIKSDKNILSIGFFTPSGRSLGTINNSGSFLENSTQIQNMSSLESSIDNHHKYVLQKNIYIKDENCCECTIKNVSGQSGKYYYLLQIKVSTNDLIARIQKIKIMSLMILIFLITLALILSHYLSIYLVKRLDRLNSKISKIIDNKNIDVDMEIEGNDEISIIENNFKILLDLLKESEFEKIHSEKEKILSTITSQVAHDIRSPLSALTMITGYLTEIPEEKRILIRNATQRINDIANELLQTSKTMSTLNTIASHSPTNTKSTEFIPALVDILISEKRMQFREYNALDIQTDLKNSFGCFCEINSKELKRAISNLINNAIEAFDNFNGTVIVGVKKCDFSENRSIEIFIADNGKGIPVHLINQLGQKGISHGKSSSHHSGNGLGLYHARQTALSCGGILDITSTEGKGTIVKFILPLAPAPKWFAQKIDLTDKKYLISLDDDTSIHQIWSERLYAITSGQKFSDIKHIKFQSGEIFEEYVHTNANKFKETLFLIDFELLNQPKTGLDLIEELHLAKNAILITSRYEEKDIQDRALRINLHVLPKTLAGFLPFEIQKPKLKVDAVILDNDDLIIMMWKMAAKENSKSILYFSNREDLLAKLAEIDNNCPFYVDENLGNDIKGGDVTKELFNLGFKNLYLATGYPAHKFKHITWLKAVVGKEPTF